jgi:hypothetical protein
MESHSRTSDQVKVKANSLLKIKVEFKVDGPSRTV